MSDSLKSDFDKFVTKHRFNLQKQVKIHGKSLRAGINVAEAIIAFKTKKTPLALVKGLTSAFLTLSDSEYFVNLFSEKNGWKKMSKDNSVFLELILPYIRKFPTEKMQLNGGNSQIQIIHFPSCEIMTYNERYDDEGRGFYYRHMEFDQDNLIDKIVEAVYSDLDLKFFSIDLRKDKTQLVSENDYKNINVNVDKYISILQKAQKLNINRSWMLYGMPGTGKSTIARAIVEKLNYKTIKMRYSDFQKLSIPLANILISKLKIDAIIIDDFDQVPNSNLLLEILEMFNQKCKLTISIVNSLKAFHPAIVRPDRFDETIIINSVDEEVIAQMLGELKNDYLDKVKHFPIAYIIELVDRYKLYGKESLESNFEELNGRVEEQSKILK